MSLATLDLPRLSQTDLKNCLESDSEFANVTMLIEKSGDVQYYQDLATACMTPKAGKIGICGVVGEVTGRKRDPGVRFGPYDFDFAIWFLEFQQENMGASGSGITTIKLARWASTILEGYSAGGLIQNFTNFQIKPEILSILGPDRQQQIAGFTGWKLTFKGPEGTYQRPEQVTSPLISPRDTTAPQTVTLTCGTAGADIYYTLDLSHPWAGNFGKAGDNLVTTSEYTAGSVDVAGLTVGARYILTLNDGTVSAFIAADTTKTFTNAETGDVGTNVMFTVYLAACQLYSVPFTVSTAAVLSCRAFKTGSIGSNRVATQYT